MLEFWATATVHHYSIRFKMDNKKHIVNLESLREMLHICPRLRAQSFVEPPFEEEILAFLRFFGHSGAIRRLTDGLYHKRNVDFAYLMWEDLVYHVEHKDTNKSNEMYYPRFTKAIIHHFMSKDPSIPRRNKTKASVRKTKSSSDTTVTPPPTATADEGTGTITGVLDVPTDESEEEISWNSTDEEGDDDERDDGDDGEEGNDDDDDAQDGDAQDDDDQEDEGNDEDDQDEGSDDEQASDKEEFIHPSLST
nr:hypothetical protein [Tanacetum cinerariifolium]